MPNLPLLLPRRERAPRLSPLPPLGPSLLARLGVHGMLGIEDAVLAGLVTGDPVLLVGAHGAAKTLVAQRIADALRLRFWAYDAAKANFEDLIGFPVPDSLNEDQVRYARTALSVLDKEFVLVDEISRASASMQSKWLEIIRARKVMGMKLDSLRVVFAAMNPAGDYAGAIPLDRALAGRFAWILPVPEYGQMELSDRRRVLEHLGPEDAPRLGRSTSDAEEIDLPHVLAAATSRCEELRKDLHDLLTDYVLHVTTALQAGGVRVDGRRASMLFRNLPAFLAAREVRTGTSAGKVPYGLRPHLWEALRLSMPFAATGETVSEATLRAAHGAAVKALGAGAARRSADAVLRVLSISDPIKAVEVYAEVGNDFAPADHAGFVTRLEDAIKARRKPAELARHALAARRLARLYQTGKVRAPADPVRRVFFLCRDAIRGDAFGDGDCDDVLRRFLARPDEALVYRLASCAVMQEPNKFRAAARGLPRVRVAPRAVLADAVEEVRQEVAPAEDDA